MEYLSIKSVLSVSLVTGLLLLLGQSVAVAPGDVDERCRPVPQYPVSVKVLMDSWRYHTLIAGVWTATTSDRRRMMPETVASKNYGSKVRSYTDTIHPYLQWSSEGNCSGGSASVCAGGGGKRLRTQFINKNLSESHTDPVRIYVKVTYSFTDCLGKQRHCDVELLRATHSNGYGSGGIMPNNLIEYNIAVTSGTKQFFFDYGTSVTGFFLALRSREACVNVSRVLVYRYECPGSDRLPPTSLLRRPATPAPVRGQIRHVTPYCAENAHLRNETLTIACTSNGIWNDGVVARCECDSGYREDEEGTTCEAIPTVALPHKTTVALPYQTTVALPYQTTVALPYQTTVAFPRKTTVALPYQTTVAFPHKTTVALPYQTATEDSANPTPSASLSSSTSVAGKTTVLVTSFISPSATPLLPTKEVEGRSGEDDRKGGSGGPSIAILAGVGASLVIILLALVLVIVLVLIIVRNRNKKSKNNQIHISSDGKQLSNPVYDGVSRNIPVSASNGNGLTGHKQDTDTLRDFHNPLYHTPQHSRHSNGVSENHTTQNGKIFDEPQYSVPDGNGIAQSEYELPVTTPTTSPPPPPVYDYATPAMAPEYATLDPPVHTYHTLELNGPAGRGGEENVEEQEYSFIGEK